MEIKYAFKNCSVQEKETLQRYMEQKMSSLEHALERYSSPPHSVEVKVEQFAKKKAFNVSFHVHTPRGTVLSSEDDHTIAEALDLAKDKLVRQLTKK